MDMNNKWHSIKIEEIYETLKCDEHGLTTKKAKEHEQKYGKNVLPKEKKDGPLKIFLSQFFKFCNKMVYTAVCTGGLNNDL